ncbi:hypothetical protein AB0I28_33135 [Phytomonospora sp. NPDC050363]|uniref:hypothetical protein n=1 Tax=Phytomonospora sp. NPDC050363 TaxID=3155642 RepID=UPI0033D8BC08
MGAVVTLAGLARWVVAEGLAVHMSPQRLRVLADSDPAWPVPPPWPAHGGAYMIAFDEAVWRDYFARRTVSPGRPRGRAGIGKLTDGDVAWAAGQKAAGRRVPALAAELGVSKSLLYAALRRARE